MNVMSMCMNSSLKLIVQYVENSVQKGTNMSSPGKQENLTYLHSEDPGYNKAKLYAEKECNKMC